MSHDLKTGGNRGYLRIATEEAFATKEQLDGFKRIIEDGYDDPGFLSLWGFYTRADTARAQQALPRLLSLGEQRIADMDAAGIDKAVLSLTGPGVQVFKRDEAVGLVEDANDQLKAACDRFPDRFFGMTSIAPQDPSHAAREIARGASMGFRGIMINSHTDGEYLDNPKFDPIFEAAVAVGQPIYIHPVTPPRTMIGPMLEAGLEGAIFGFGVEVGLHLLRVITAGVFDRWPTLQIVVGHMGEGLPFWLYRIDHFHQVNLRAKRYPTVRALKKGSVSAYMRENVLITTSGMAWETAIKFAQSVIGVDRVMYAMDYPYQYLPDEVRVYDTLDISDDDKKKLMQTNAERVFKL